LKMREPFLSETDAPPRRRSLTLATPQKIFFLFFILRAPNFPPSPRSPSVALAKDGLPPRPRFR